MHASPDNDGAPVHAGLRGVDRFEWERIVRRARIPSSTKYLALMLSTYANPDGTRVEPGVDRLEIVMQVSRRTVLRALSDLRELGLIQRVKQGNRHAKQSDSYRLTVPLDMPYSPDIALLDPDETELSGGHG
ncbi:helix-turn-helix domain-containing protein [Nocardia brasiliensis]|uniref:helix-turn-helix domain-containing protein n=1 Tax=Nocardia brasiliensis TaxID=37326 RepID=UPI000AF33615|nr:helix-turn-helix domain-containing protein [Nocardia brasiliensis]